MDLILTDKNGKDIRFLNFSKYDFDIGNENDFEITIPLDEWGGDIQMGCFVYDGGEIGGVIGKITTDTESQTVIIGGYTWRGLLAKKIIEPTQGQDYKTVSGDLNNIIAEIINGEFDGFIKASDTLTGINISSYQFDRYTDFVTGLNKCLSTKNYKLKIEYKQAEQGLTGYVEVSAVPLVDYSSEIELSQDSRLNFKIDMVNNFTNHLIVLGDGELKDRKVLHLYADQNGKISQTQTLTGINEITEVYENTGSEDLLTDGTEHFEELIKNTDFRMDVQSLGIDVEIGDIIGGRDYITGNNIKKPLGSKIITFADGEKTVQYNLEGQE